jgi:hydroxyethylthiazole kinase
MNDVANVSLAIGASPVMSHAREEVEDMVALAKPYGALVLNPGTLDSHQIEAMILAGKKANRLGIPVMLDPVGAGATPFRTAANHRLLGEIKVDILKGNSGEIGALAGEKVVVKGVDSIAGTPQPERVVVDLARKYGLVVAMTGKQDYITDGKTLYEVWNGHPAVGQTLTGTGCMVTALVAAFVSVCPEDKAFACSAALTCFGVAAELALFPDGGTPTAGTPRVGGPGSFKAELMDCLFNLNEVQLAKLACVRSHVV